MTDSALMMARNAETAERRSADKRKEGKPAMTNNELGKIILNTHRDGYATDQVFDTMTVGELIELLEDYDPETPIYFGNDRRSYGWYTYGRIEEYDIHYFEPGQDVEEEEDLQ